MSTRSLTIASLLSVAFLCMSSAASAGLLGKTLQVAYYTNSIAVTPSVTTFTVGSTVEITNWPSFSFPSGLNPIKLSIDANDTSITISNMNEVIRTWTTNTSPSYYLVFTDINDTLPDFSADVTKTFLSKTITNLTNADITVTNNSISLYLNGAVLPTRTPDGFFTLQVGFASTDPTPTPIPTPATILMMISGLLIGRTIKSRKII